MCIDRMGMGGHGEPRIVFLTMGHGASKSVAKTASAAAMIQSHGGGRYF